MSLPSDDLLFNVVWYAEMHDDYATSAVETIAYRSISIHAGQQSELRRRRQGSGAFDPTRNIQRTIARSTVQIKSPDRYP